MREGTEDITKLFPEIKETWARKGITQKQHYSEPCEGAFTGREMRKHSPRVAVLPPCDDSMDLMIEAKDKEQAVFELYRKYGIGGENLFREVIPHERADDNRPKGKKGEPLAVTVPDEEIGMGGPERRVYWPLGNEHWLSPRKRTVKKAQPEREAKDRGEEEEEAGHDGNKITTKKPRRKNANKAQPDAEEEEKGEEEGEGVGVNETATKKPRRKKAATKTGSTPSRNKKSVVLLPTLPSTSSVSSTKRISSRRAAIAARKSFAPQLPVSSGLSSPPSEGSIAPGMTDTEDVSVDMCPDLEKGRVGQRRKRSGI
jgi:UV DNA damage endonuclease